MTAEPARSCRLTIQPLKSPVTWTSSTEVSADHSNTTFCAMDDWLLYAPYKRKIQSGQKGASSQQLATAVILPVHLKQSPHMVKFARCHQPETCTAVKHRDLYSEPYLDPRGLSYDIRFRAREYINHLLHAWPGHDTDKPVASPIGLLKRNRLLPVIKGTCPAATSRLCIAIARLCQPQMSSNRYRGH